MAPLLTLAALLGATPSADLTCTLARSSPRGAPLVLEFTLTNRGDRPLAVLDWNTPLEGMVGDAFVIRLDGGDALPYRGPLIKRGDPEREEYVEVAPGKAATASVEPGL